MPPVDFSKPQTFFNTLESFALALNCAMIALRNEAGFHDQYDQAIVEAANIFASMLEDAKGEVEVLLTKIEAITR
jgi:hypothetical protein